ncbi:MAG TPA: flagellar biosynthetic protein FliR, partial [Tepidisphaeraceae bacterium]
MDEFRRFLEIPGLKGAAQIGSLLFARLLPVIVFTPVFGGQTVPRRFRFGLAFLFAVALLPAFYPSFEQVIAPGEYGVLLAKEAVVGMTLSLFVLILFETLSAVGALIDLSRGATLANVLDPMTQNQQSILAVFFTQLALVLFLSIGGVQILMRALADSFILLGPRQLIPTSLVGPAATSEAIGLVGDLFLLAFRMAAPAVIVVFLLDFALGVINRVAPQIQVYFLGLTT